ncbi:hypothetical protein [Zobellia russellii]|uniref:hypothetical protein n=1 Tax=Zobellia russellii TaxID=248907 RepID=UPI001BFF8268|nr:hypothetical protein [Zobellia russellii]MBT9187759.1 hypothetical protein [Zobellia russellii]
MKLKVDGFTKYELDGSFVYFIFSKDIVYIGETQKITFSRWVQHFHKTGTFSLKVKKQGTPSIDYFDKVNLVSVELNEIRENYPAVKWRTITQAVEHSLHVLLTKSPSILLKTYFPSYEPEFDYFKIVSDTSRSTPKSLKIEDWKFAEQYSENIIEKVVDYIT